MKIDRSAADGLLETVCRSADALLAAAEPYGGFVPSLLDRATGRMLDALPSPIPGQRNADRSGGGSNLMHDQVLLRTLLALAAAADRPGYAGAVDRYLHRFVARCTETVSGLFPWGEHAYWDLTADRIGDSYLHHDPRRAPRPTHDHLRAAPLWLWERLWTLDPACVLRFARGLGNHWTEDAPGAPREYIRHALIQKRQPYPRDLSSADFPRHSGFYIHDLAFAYARSGEPDLLHQLRAFADYWWERREATNLCVLESRRPPDPKTGRTIRTPSPGQTLSLAVSLTEAAGLLAGRQPDLAAELRRRAAAYTEGFLAAPHDPQRGVFLNNCRGAEAAMPIWGSRYGDWPAAYVAIFALCGYRLTGDRRLLEWSMAAGHAYREEPFPERTAVPAMDAGLALALLADLYDLTGEGGWRDAGLTLAADLTSRYLDRPIPRGAAGIEWYESQMGPGFLLHALARLALLIRDREHCPLEADYTTR